MSPGLCNVLAHARELGVEGRSVQTCIMRNPVLSPQRVGRLRTQSLPALWLHWRRFAERIKLTVSSEGHRVHRPGASTASCPLTAGSPRGPDTNAPISACCSSSSPRGDAHGNVQVVQEADERIGVARGDGPHVCELPSPSPHARAAPWSGAAPTAQINLSPPTHVPSRVSCGPADCAGSAENGNNPTCDPRRPGQVVQSAPEPVRNSCSVRHACLPGRRGSAARQ